MSKMLRKVLRTEQEHLIDTACDRAAFMNYDCKGEIASGIKSR